MDLLFLGGTRFVGKYAVQTALERGHRVTLVHRKPSDLFPEAEHLYLDRLDRVAGLQPLAGRTFDGLIDVSAYIPAVVRDLAEVVKGNIGHALYVSTVSVYAPPAPGDPTDTTHAPLHDATGLRGPDANEVVTEETYGPLKVACEQEFFEHFPTGSVVRPTYVVGPDDYTDRFTYWARRASAGGDILVTAPPDAPIQLVDARDLGDFMVTLVERRTAGIFDGVGPALPLTVAEMLAACAAAAGTAIDLVPAERGWLESQGVDVGSQLPLLDGPAEWFAFARDPAPSLAAGLSLRPLEETARDTIAWDRARGLPPINALSPERETELLSALRS